MEIADALRKLGARDVDIVLLSSDPERAFMAIDAAQAKGADNVIRYAITLFEDEAWQPGRGTPRRITNASAPIPECPTCGGDRFVLVETRPVVQSGWAAQKGIEPTKGAVTEGYAPCPDCNANADTSFWRADGSRSRALDPAQVRERMVQ